MTIRARFAGRCPVCGGSIAVGDAVEWSKGTRARHVTCPAAATLPAQAATPADGALTLSGGEGYGCRGWQVGEVVLSSEDRRRAGGPDGLVILSAGSRYYRDDGLCFGVGDDQGRAYWATARAATPDELQPAINAAHGRALLDERVLEMARVRRLFEAAGYLPETEADRLANGRAAEALLLDRGTNGGRLWVVIEPEALALVCGGYYDDYRRSAQRLPRTPALEARVRALCVAE